MQPSSSRDFKHTLLTCLTKLSDRDTHSSASTELHSIAKTLTHNNLSLFISSIIITNPSDKPFVRKQCLALISTLCHAHGSSTTLSPYVPKLINYVVKRLRDSDSSVRACCVTAAGDIAKVSTFLSVVKPFVEALVTEQDYHAQVGSALCVAAVVRHAPEKDTAYLKRLVQRVERLLKSEVFKAKAALMSVLVCVIDVGCCDGLVTVKSLVNLMVEFVVKSEDWSVRKGAAEVLEKLAVVERELCKEFKSSCLKTFEAKRFDKVKSVRETMNQMIEAWNAVPDEDGEMSPKVDLLAPRTPQMMSRRTVPHGSSSSTSTKRNSFENTTRKTGPAMFRKLDRKKPNDQKLDTDVATPPSIVVTKDEGILKHRSRKHEIKRVLFNEISDEKTLESHCHEERSTSGVVESNANLEINVVQQESEDLSLIRNQLAQIETQQATLFDLLEKFIGSSQNGMQSLESRVHGLESTLDEISFDLAKSSGRLSNPKPTPCCKFPGADFLSSKLWKKTETRHMTIKTTNRESHNPQNTGFHLQPSRSGLIKNPLAERHQM